MRFLRGYGWACALVSAFGWAFCGALSAQTIAREVVSSSGAVVAKAPLGEGGAPCSMTWVIGEPIGETYVGSKKIVSQGFLQGEGFIRDTISMDTAWQQLGVEKGQRIEMLCYPNPTTGPLQVQFREVNYSGGSWMVDCVLTDMRGRSLQKQELGGLPNERMMDLSSYPAGVYFLQVRCRPATWSPRQKAVNGALASTKVYKIIKK